MKELALQVFEEIDLLFNHSQGRTFCALGHPSEQLQVDHISNGQLELISL